VHELYIGPKGKKYETLEELGAVERRGVDLSPPKGKKKVKINKKGKFKGQASEGIRLPKLKTKLLGVKTKSKGGIISSKSIAKKYFRGGLV
jgi:hypothetical protein